MGIQAKKKSILKSSLDQQSIIENEETTREIVTACQLDH